MIFGLSSIQLSTLEFPIASYIWYFHKYIVVVVSFFVLVKTGTQRLCILNVL